MRFDEKAHSYDQFSEAQQELINFGKDYLPTKKQPGTVMEFGAGTGLLTKNIIDRHDHVFSSDISEMMVEKGKENFPEALWAVMNAWNPLQNTKYDAIYSSALLQWCPDPIGVLSKWRNCLKPDGKLVSFFFIDETHKELREIDPNFSALQWKTRIFWETALDHANFTITRSDDLKKEIDYKSAMAFFKAIHGTGSTTTEISSVANIKKLLKAYQEKFSKATGVTATWHFYKVECTPFVAGKL